MQKITLTMLLNGQRVMDRPTKEATCKVCYAAFKAEELGKKCPCGGKIVDPLSLPDL